MGDDVLIMGDDVLTISFFFLSETISQVESANLCFAFRPGIGKEGDQKRAEVLKLQFSYFHIIIINLLTHLIPKT